MTDIEENLQTPRMNLDTFLQNNNIRNSWIYERDIQAYVRRSVRFVNEIPIPCLDIATVDVTENHRGRGIFTEFLHRVENAAQERKRGVFVESIINTRLLKFLLKNGYHLCANSNELCPSVIKTFS